MSWGTDFKTDVFLSHQSYSSKYEVEDKINELNENIRDNISLIKMYVSSSPKDLIPDEFSKSPINWLNNEVNDLIESYNEDLIEKYKLELYLEYLNYCEEMNTGTNKSIKDLLWNFSNRIDTLHKSELSEEEHEKECNIAINEVIDEITTKLLM